MCLHTGSCSVVFTSDEGIRGGKTIPLKATVDEALEGCESVRTVFVSKRTGAKVNFITGRDVLLEDVSYLLMVCMHICTIIA